MTQLEFSFDRQLQEGDQIISSGGKVYDIRRFKGVLCAMHGADYHPVSIVLALWKNFKICYKT